MERGSYLGFPKGFAEKGLNPFGDVVLNVLVFFPVGFLFYGWLRSNGRCSGLTRVLIVFFSGTLLSLGAESMQHFSATRHSSVIDLTMNATGTAAGILLNWVYGGLLEKRAKRFFGDLTPGQRPTQTDTNN
jgi:glycopeptide antibiotics resistance protein